MWNCLYTQGSALFLLEDFYLMFLLKWKKKPFECKIICLGHVEQLICYNKRGVVLIAKLLMEVATTLCYIHQVRSCPSPDCLQWQLFQNLKPNKTRRRTQPMWAFGKLQWYQTQALQGDSKMTVSEARTYLTDIPPGSTMRLPFGCIPARRKERVCVIERLDEKQSREWLAVGDSNARSARYHEVRTSWGTHV